jgi:hypothetical protein
VGRSFTREGEPGDTGAVSTSDGLRGRSKLALTRGDLQGTSNWLVELTVAVSIESRRGLFPGETGTAELDEGSYEDELLASWGVESMKSK